MTKLEQTRQAALSDLNFEIQGMANRVTWLEDEIREAELRGDRADAMDLRRQLADAMTTLGKLHDLLDYCSAR